MVLDMMGPFITLMVFMMVFFVFIAFTDSMLENDCKAYLADHGYNFVRYHKPGLFGGSEECWGEKGGTNARVY